MLALGFVLVGTVPACLSATPPKTPNQRAVERQAPQVKAPPPPDAGRIPRPAATAGASAPSLEPAAPTRQ
jgi:hypothetical protein